MDQNSEDNQASFQSGFDKKVHPESLLSIVIPPDSLIKFKESYDEEALKWPSDLAITTDFQKFEQFVSSAHSLVRRWLPQDLIFRLESFMHDPNQPSAVVIRGLPIDDNLPPSTPEGHRHKNSSQQFMSETWLVGIARIVGQPFNYEFLAKAAGVAAEGMGLLIRQLYPMPEQEKLVSALGSREFLDFHMDGFQVLPQCYPNCLVFIGLRGDPSKVAKTLLCDFRELYSELNPDAIDILLREKITWKAPSLPGAAGFCKHILEGTEANPVINIYDENIGVSTTFDEVVGGSAAAVAAYRHAKEVARKVGVRREGVWLDAGDVLLVNQRRCAHGRRAFAAAYDGKDRWMQRVYVNEGAIWEPTGLVPWPIRALPFEFAHKVEA